MDNCSLTFDSLPEELERKDVYGLFQPFGTIKKLYINPSNRTGRIILDSQESTEEARAALHNAPPYFLKLYFFNSTKSNYFNHSSSQGKADSLPRDKMNFLNDNKDDDDDVMASCGPELVNVNGIQVSTFVTDDGEIYVPLSEVKAIGFELFDPQAVPKRLNYDVQLAKEFELYLAMKTRKFMAQRNCKLSDSIINATKQRMKVQAFGGKDTTYLQNERKFNNRSINQYNDKHYDDRKQEIQTNENRQLRKPYSDIDGSQRNYERTRESGAFNSFDKDTNQRNYERKKENGTFNSFDKDSSQRNFDRKKGTNMGKNTFVNSENVTRYQNRFENGETEQLRTEQHSTYYKPDTNNIIKNDANSVKPDTETVTIKSDIKTSVETSETYIKPKDNEKKTVLKKCEPSYNQINLNLNTEIEVEITHVDSKDKCWVYLKDQKDVLEEILLQTNLEAEKVSSGQAKVGKICAATFMDTWYRVIVLNTQPTLKVLYIDFGNKNTEHVKEIRDLPNSLTEIPGLAVCITFSDPPSKILEIGLDMKIIPNKKLSSETYLVSEVVHKKVNPILKELSAQSADVQFITSTPTSVARKNEELPLKVEKTLVKSVNAVSNCSLGAIPKNTVIKNDKKTDDNSPNDNATKHTRSSVIKSVSSEGQLQCLEIINDNTTLAFILPNANLDDIVALENLSADVKPDKNFTAQIGDLVAVLDEKEGWARGLIINMKNDKYVAALVDYATITESSEICALKDNYFNIPEFSCVCTCNSDSMDLMKKFKGIEIQCTIIEANKLKLQFSNGATCIVNCEKWDPFLTSPLAAKNDKVITASHTRKSLKTNPIFTGPPQVKPLKDGDIVIIVNAYKNKLLLRTKECNMLFKTVAEEISKLKPQPLESPPVVNQLVLSNFESSTELYRAIVTSIDGEMVELDFFDYGNRDNIPIANLRQISETLAYNDSTLIPVILKSYENGTFGSAELEELAKYFNTRIKFSVKTTPDPRICDLLNGQNYLSEQLQSLERPRSALHSRASSRSSVITYQKLLEPNLPLGSHQLFCINIEDLSKGSVVFIPTDEEITQSLLSLTDEITEHVLADNTSYCPKVNEICLATFEGGWYRAKVTSANNTNDSYEVYFIDFGNSCTVLSRDIRKIPSKFTILAPIAINCVFQDIAQKQVSGKLISKLKDLLEINNAYDVDVISKHDKVYSITIPSITKVLKMEGLL